MATVTSFGAAQTVTGSCHLVNIGSVQILVDCGMFQDSGGGLRNYEPFGFNPREIDYLILTHGHLDHIGRLPKLIKEGFNGEIIATPPTYEIAEIMLLDSAHILEEEYKTRKKKACRRAEEDSVLEPLYTKEHVRKVLAKEWRTLDYSQNYEIQENITISLGNAGHIMGSAFVVIDYSEERIPKRMVFSGDIGSPHRLIIENGDIIKEADVLFIESTYGDRNHKPLQESVDEFKRTVDTTLKRGGNVLIPSFALERTQEILWLLREMFEDGELPECRVFLDSPLAIKATNLYNQYPVHLSDELEWEISIGEDPFSFDWLELTSTREESMKINEVESGTIIIAGSGMCTGGRILHHLKNRLWNAKNTVIFPGFQVHGTLGRDIIDGNKFVNIYGEDIIVKAQINTINGFSAHADQNDLIAWIGNFKKLNKVCLIHGEADNMETFSKIIEKKLNKDTYIMEYGVPLTLS